MHPSVTNQTDTYTAALFICYLLMSDELAK